MASSAISTTAQYSSDRKSSDTSKRTALCSPCQTCLSEREKLNLTRTSSIKKKRKTTDPRTYDLREGVYSRQRYSDLGYSSNSSEDIEGVTLVKFNMGERRSSDSQSDRTARCTCKGEINYSFHDSDGDIDVVVDELYNLAENESNHRQLDRRDSGYHTTKKTNIKLPIVHHTSSV